jgi:hypothetical protein
MVVNGGSGVPKGKNTLAPALPDKPVEAMSVDERIAVLKRAGTGDAQALQVAKKLLTAVPALVTEFGNLEQAAESALLSVLTTDALSREIYSRKLAALRVELAGPTPTPLERLLVGRIVACWLQVQHADAQLAHTEAQSITLKQGAYHRDRQDRAHRRYLQAITALARVRRLQLPTVQVNIAQQQIVANGASVGDTGPVKAVADG